MLYAGWRHASRLAFLTKGPDNLLVIQIRAFNPWNPVLDVAPLTLEVLQLDPALVPALLAALPRHLGADIAENLFVPLSIEVMEDRLLHQDAQEPCDLRVSPVRVPVPLVGGGVLHIGGQRDPAYLTAHRVIHCLVRVTDQRSLSSVISAGISGARESRRRVLNVS